uniref:Bm14261 n=1 Tax=Brugia malayi TaxID=6279 RepID=A0A1I9G456_BRUMA|nr:Bm14261 [Brugia malayi]
MYFYRKKEIVANFTSSQRKKKKLSKNKPLLVLIGFYPPNRE